MATWNSRGLRGSLFEEEINRTNETYKEQKLCLIQKIPTPITPIRMDKESSQITVSLRDEKNEEDSTIQDIREIVRRRGSRGIALATLGLEIRRRHRGFNVKLYGYSQLYRFIESIPDLEVIGDRADRKVVYRAKN